MATSQHENNDRSVEIPGAPGAPTSTPSDNLTMSPKDSLNPDSYFDGADIDDPDYFSKAMASLSEPLFGLPENFTFDAFESPLDLPADINSSMCNPVDVTASDSDLGLLETPTGAPSGGPSTSQTAVGSSSATTSVHNLPPVFQDIHSPDFAKAMKDVVESTAFRSYLNHFDHWFVGMTVFDFNDPRLYLHDHRLAQILAMFVGERFHRSGTQSMSMR